MRPPLRRIPSNRRKNRVQKVIAPRTGTAARLRAPRRGSPLPPPLPPDTSALEPPTPVEGTPLEASAVEVELDEVQAVVRALEVISREVPPYASYEVSIELGDADIVETLPID